MLSAESRRELPISETGNPKLDKAFFCWATKVLNKNVDMEKASQSFSRLEDSYNDKERFYHRGTGHPRQLLPEQSQDVYKQLLSSPVDAKLNYLVDQIENKMPQSGRIREAEEIVGGFYHDVVHRNGKRPDILNQFAIGGDEYAVLAKSVPATSAVLGDPRTRRVEDLSCIVAEMELNQLNIPKQYIVPIVLAIFSTIPFSPVSIPANLTRRLQGVTDMMKLGFSPDEMRSAVGVAIAVANRDHGSYGEGSLDEFNKKSCAMMYERNLNLLKPDHKLEEEASTIFGFYEFHKDLYQRVTAGKISIFHSLDELDQTTLKLNSDARQTLKLDIVLQGLQLATLMIRMSKQERQNKNTSAVNPTGLNMQFPEDLSKMKYPDDMPRQVIQVLENHGKECTVNGISFIRGNENAALTLQLVKLIGVKPMLDIADNFLKHPVLDVDMLLNPKHGSTPNPDYLKERPRLMSDLFLSANSRKPVEAKEKHDDAYEKKLRR